MNKPLGAFALVLAFACQASAASAQNANLLCFEPLVVPGTAELLEVRKLETGNALLRYDTGVFVLKPGGPPTLLIPDRPQQGPDANDPWGYGPTEQRTKGILIALNDGLFEVDTVKLTSARVAGAPTGIGSIRQATDGTQILVVDDQMWAYNFESNQLGDAEPYPTSHVYRPARSGRISGLFSPDDEGPLLALVDNSIKQLGQDPIGRIGLGMLVAMDDVILIQDVRGIPLLIDSQSLEVTPVAGLPSTRLRPLLQVTSGGFAFFQVADEIYLYDRADRSAKKLDGLSGVEDLVTLDATHVLLLTANATFVLAADGSLKPSNLPVGVSLERPSLRAGGNVHLLTDLGMFRLDLASGVATQLDVDIAEFSTWDKLNDESILIGRHDGTLVWLEPGETSSKLVWRFDRAIEDIFVSTAPGLPLIRAGGQYHAVDPTGAARPRPLGAGSSEDDSLILLNEGNIAIDRSGVGLLTSTLGTWSNLTIDPAFDAANLRPGLGTPFELSFVAKGPCTDQLASLDLALRVSRNGSTAQPQEFRLNPYDKLGDGEVVLMSSVLVDVAGMWQFQLVQNDTPVGVERSLQIFDSSPWELLQTYWKLLLSFYVVFEVAAVAGLVVAAHWSTSAFTVLSDEGLARLVTWPFFLLRNVPFVQRWILAPWFTARRRAVNRGLDFLDPPVTASNGTVKNGTELLSRLSETRLIWLTGRSGMGKSALFYAWERDYFPKEDTATLEASYRRFGFVLITIPVRYYDDLPISQAAPEAWVIEAVRRRLEEFGISTKTAVVDAMLRSGKFALAFDGTNEADCESALELFGRQYPRTRVIATSQSRPLLGWEVWRLPETIKSLKSELLELWMPGQGTQLAKRLAAPGIADVLVSGYDLRLIADLAKSDPVNAPLPANRVGLYQAILSRAGQEQPLQLSQLEKLAWEMTITHRREIRVSDEAALGTGVLDHLANEDVRVVRKLGTTFEFRHDLMRAFLAASWLAQELPTIAAITTALEDKGVFELPRREQADLWSFLVLLINDDKDLAALWLYAVERADTRGILTSFLQEEADRRGMVLTRTAVVRPKEPV